MGHPVSPELLGAATVNSFFISEPKNVHQSLSKQDREQQLKAPAESETSKLVVTTHNHNKFHDVAIMSRLAKNVYLTATFCSTILNSFSYISSFEFIGIQLSYGRKNKSAFLSEHRACPRPGTICDNCETSVIRSLVSGPGYNVPKCHASRTS